MIYETDLAGAWMFALDPGSIGIQQEWFTIPLPDTIGLPGSVDEARKTPLTKGGTMAHLSRRHPYVGKAWYARDVTVNAEADGMFHWLVLERPHGEVTVWIDGYRVGRDESLSTPNRFFLGPVAAGVHRITLLIDNDRFEAVGDALLTNPGPALPDVAHSKTDHTQTNWNGVVGRIALEAERAGIARLDVTASTHQAALRIELECYDSNRESPTFWLKPTQDVITLTFQLAGVAAPFVVNHTVVVDNAYTPIDLTVDLPPEAKLWDEFSPNVQSVTVEWLRDDLLMARRSTRFGIRSFVADGRRLRLNGRAVFLRGTLDCCIFPLTGYPPTDKDGWRKVFSTAKSYGLNHIRYHSYCPPKAAFEVADEMGMLLAVETPVWAVLGSDPKLDRYVHTEAERIIAEYGNHPSFVMMTVGNEIAGPRLHSFLERFMEKWQALDRRRVYNGSSGWPTTRRADYLSKFGPRSYRWGEGLDSRLNARPLETRTDWAQWVDSVPVPLVSHEIGEWCAYPNLAEIPKYAGVLEARNFEIVRDDLAAKGLLHLAPDFTAQSGRLQTQLYKEDIEAALRTRDFGGFQLLGLQDFPGQGTAIVGVVDAFWDAKPYVTGAEFSRFCAPVVPLLRAHGFVVKAGDMFAGDVQLAQFSAQDMPAGQLNWSLTDQQGHVVRQGVLLFGNLATGHLHDIGQIAVVTNELASGQYRFGIDVDGTGFGNDWSVWIFASETALPLRIVQSLTPDVLDAIEAGETIILAPQPEHIRKTSDLGQTTIFWGTLWTQKQAPQTLGLINDLSHPIFADFPAGTGSDWHFWDLTYKRRPFDIAATGFAPIIRVIDDWFTNQDLALLAEARLGLGRLILCAADIESDLDTRPVAKAFHNALAKCESQSSERGQLMLRQTIENWWHKQTTASI